DAPTRGGQAGVGPAAPGGRGRLLGLLVRARVGGCRAGRRRGRRVRRGQGVRRPEQRAVRGRGADRLCRQPVRLRLLDQQPQLQGQLRLRSLLPGLIARSAGDGVQIPVALFARYREVVGRGRVEVEVAEDATVEDVWTALTTAHPTLTRYRPHTLFAVGSDYVQPSHRVHAGEEVACFPPVSGGTLSCTGWPPSHCPLTRSPPRSPCRRPEASPSSWASCETRRPDGEWSRSSTRRTSRWPRPSSRRSASRFTRGGPVFG